MAIAVEVGGEVLQEFFLWALCRVAGETLLDGRFPSGCYDLHARPDSPGSTRAGHMPVLDPEEALALLRGAASPLTRASTVLQLLPSLRDRLALTLRFGLELEPEVVISVLCDSDPEGAEFGSSVRADAARRESAMANLRSIFERSRRRIEDSLNGGHAGLLALVDGARSARLPPWASSVLADWTGAWRPTPLCWRRAESMARLVWMRGAERPAEVLRQSLVPPDQLAPARHALWRWAAEDEYRLPSRFEALSAAGSPEVVTAFLLRYVCWRHGRERPSRTTLGAVLLGLPPDRATGERVGRMLANARVDVIAHLERDPNHRGGPPDRRPFGIDQILGRRKRGIRPSTSPRERVDFSRSLRRRLSEALPTPAPDGAAWTAWQQLRDRVSRLLPPRWAVGSAAGPGLDLAPAPVLRGRAPGAGAKVRLQVASAEHLEPLRPVVIREARGRVSVLHPTAPDRFPTLGEFPASGADQREISVTLGPHPGPCRYILALVDRSFDVDWDAPEATRWEPLRRSVSAGEVPAGETWVMVGPEG